MQSLTVSHFRFNARRLPIDLQLIRPFTSRSLVITGSCEKSLLIIKVTPISSLSVGLTLIGFTLAAFRRLMRCDGATSLVSDFATAAGSVAGFCFTDVS